MDKRRFILEIAHGKNPQPPKVSGIDIDLWLAAECGETSPKHGAWLEACAAMVSGYKDVMGEYDYRSLFAKELRLYGHKMES